MISASLGLQSGWHNPKLVSRIVTANAAGLARYARRVFKMPALAST
jgi:hypothetical protein